MLFSLQKPLVLLRNLKFRNEIFYVVWGLQKYCNHGPNAYTERKQSGLEAQLLTW